MIERAYLEGEALGLSVWCEDEAGPYRTVPHPGHGWCPEGNPGRYPHEYHPNGTAKMLTLLHPKSGEVRVKGVTSTKNAVLHPWLKEELTDILSKLPPVEATDGDRELWMSWQAGLSLPITLPSKLPPLRLLLVLDNLTGHKSRSWLLWCFSKGIMPLYTPLGGSWLNMAESIQNILKRRALNGTYPRSPQEIIDNLEAVADHWNENPTPFRWGGKRQERRYRAWERRKKRLAASGAYVDEPQNVAA